MKVKGVGYSIYTYIHVRVGTYIYSRMYVISMCVYVCDRTSRGDYRCMGAFVVCFAVMFSVGAVISYIGMYGSVREKEIACLGRVSWKAAYGRMSCPRPHT